MLLEGGSTIIGERCKLIGSQRPPFPVPQDQDHCDRQEVGKYNLDPDVVGARRRKAVPLPVQGSETQWYRIVLQNPSIGLDAWGVEAQFRAKPATDAKAVNFVIEKFREKCGAKDVKKYYSKFDVAVVAKLG